MESHHIVASNMVSMVTQKSIERLFEGEDGEINYGGQWSCRMKRTTICPYSCLMRAMMSPKVSRVFEGGDAAELSQTGPLTRSGSPTQATMFLFHRVSC